MQAEPEDYFFERCVYYASGVDKATVESFAVADK